MKTIAAIINDAATAISGDSAIATYIGTHFPGKTLTVYAGFDPSDPPGEEQAPYVVVTHGDTSYEVGTFATERRPNFSVVWVVVDKTATTASGVITKDGLTHADGLGMLIVAALQAKFGNDHFAAAQYDLDTEGVVWFGGVNVTLHYQAGTTYEP